MKWSIYNYFYKNDEQTYILYNLSSGRTVAVLNELKGIIEENLSQIQDIERLHPELFTYLCKKNFIVSRSTDEKKNASRKKKKKLSAGSNHFGIVINPTMDCNLRCWYCYETHHKDSYMKNSTIESLRIFIKNKIIRADIKFFTLSFFGGEPLLAFDNIILPLIQNTQDLCNSHTVKMNLTFTSNCVLLTQETVNSLARTGLKTYIQVPFDGNNEFHNKTKKTARGEGTYNTIISNIQYAAGKENIDFLIRCNYTPDNIESFKDLILEFTDYPQEKLSFSFHLVWQINEDKSTFNKLREIEEFLYATNKNNFHEDTRTLIPCYADSENDVVINYNGDIYNCTARDFNPLFREGVLEAGGAIIYNELHHKRMRIRDAHKACHDCIIYPICNVCSQKKLETSTTGCLRKFSEEEKKKLIYTNLCLLTNNGVQNS